MNASQETRRQKIRRILEGAKSLAVVGGSSNWKRPSFYVMKYMQSKGYRITPVNPGAAGKEILGVPAYASLSDIPYDFDLVQIFRPSGAVPSIVDEALALTREKGIRVIWMQIGVQHDEAAAKAEAAGLEVIMNHCTKIEYGRLHNELRWGGFNTGIISSKK